MASDSKLFKTYLREDDSHLERELLLYIENDSELYHKYLEDLYKRFSWQWKRKKFGTIRAETEILKVVNIGARKYQKEIDASAPFTTDIRMNVAQQLVHQFEQEAKLGNFHESITEATAGEPATELLSEIESAFKSQFPNGFFQGAVTKIIGSPVISLHFGLINDKNELTSGIRDNDPAIHKALIHGISPDGNLESMMDVDLATGGSLSTKPEAGSYLAMGRAKFGWRKKKGSPEAILKHLTNYFKKMKSVVSSNKDNVYNREKYSDKYFEGVDMSESDVKQVFADFGVYKQVFAGGKEKYYISFSKKHRSEDDATTKFYLYGDTRPKKADVEKFVKNKILKGSAKAVNRPTGASMVSHYTDNNFNIELKEAENPEDVIKMDVPLFIRMLEFAREDAAGDRSIIRVYDEARNVVGFL